MSEFEEMMALLAKIQAQIDAINKTLREALGVQK